jgi:glycosyltransferase involved in cell wall biosynthesis
MSVSVATTASKRLSSVGISSKAGSATRTMSVAIYLHDLAGGGVERQSLIIAEEFRRHGADVTLVLHRLRGQLLDQVPAGLRILDLSSSRTLMDVPRLARFLRREKPDILLSNVDLNNVAALMAKGLSLSATKVVICQHNPISSAFVTGEKWLYRHVALLYRVLSPLISRAVAVSSGVAVEMEVAAGLPRDRILTIHNPVVGPDFQSRSDALADHPWFNQPDQPVLVTAGRLVPQKDHETLLRALALHRQRANTRLVILGSGPLEHELKALTESLNLSDAVDFMGFQSNALPYIRQADAFVLSSRCEGFGNVLVEAMGCGTPVISTRCDHGPAEILDNGQFGLLVAPGDPVELAAAMDEVAGLRGRFPAEVLRQRAGDFSYAACASRYMAMFKALAPNRAWAI